MFWSVCLCVCVYVSFYVSVCWLTSDYWSEMIVVLFDLIGNRSERESKCCFLCSLFHGAQGFSRNQSVSTPTRPTPFPFPPPPKTDPTFFQPPPGPLRVHHAHPGIPTPSPPSKPKHQPDWVIPLRQLLCRHLRKSFTPHNSSHSLILGQ